jgi:hypothetical protein
MPSTNTSTLVPSLYQCVETRSVGVYWLLSHPFPHSVGHHLRVSNVLERISRPSCEPLYAINASHRKQEKFLYEYPLHWVIFSHKKKCTTEHCSSVVLSLSTVILTTETILWTWACVRRLSWSWTVLLPSDTYRKPITSITVVLLPFVTYLLTPHRKQIAQTKEWLTITELPCSVTELCGNLLLLPSVGCGHT